MKTKLSLLKSLIVITTAFTCQLRGDVEVVGLNIGEVGTPNESYTVPTGKVLLVENISAFQASNTPVTPRVILETALRVQNGAISTMRFGYPTTDKYTAISLQRPLRVPTGRILKIYFASDRGYNKCRIQGLLVDTTDLYAANIDLDLKVTEVEAGRLKAEATLASARPARLESLTSTNLADFTANTSEEKRRLADPSKWELSTSNDSDRKFMIARATAMEKR